MHHEAEGLQLAQVDEAVADLTFAQTTGERDNLLRDGMAPDQIVDTENRVIGGVLAIAARPYDTAGGP